MKNTLIFFACFMCLSVCDAMQFKIDGSYIYYKSEWSKEFGTLDYMKIWGGGYFENGKYHYIFEDKSDIKKVIDDKLHQKLYIDKANSRWIMDYNVNPPFIDLIEPRLNDKRFERNYIKQIYPVSKELNK